MDFKCYPMVTQASLAAALGVSVDRVRTICASAAGPISVSAPRYQLVFLPASVRKFLGDERPFFVVPALLARNEVQTIEKKLGRSLLTLTKASNMIPSVYFDATIIGPDHDKALGFMADLERRTYSRFQKKAA